MRSYYNTGVITILVCGRCVGPLTIPLIPHESLSGLCVRVWLSSFSTAAPSLAACALSPLHSRLLAASSFTARDSFTVASSFTAAASFTAASSFTYSSPLPPPSQLPPPSELPPPSPLPPPSELEPHRARVGLHSCRLLHLCLLLQSSSPTVHASASPSLQSTGRTAAPSTIVLSHSSRVTPPPAPSPLAHS